MTIFLRVLRLNFDMISKPHLISTAHRIKERENKMPVLSFKLNCLNQLILRCIQEALRPVALKVTAKHNVFSFKIKQDIS